MPDYIDDRDEAAVVLQQLVTRANLNELLGPVRPATTSLG